MTKGRVPSSEFGIEYNRNCRHSPQRPALFFSGVVSLNCGQVAQVFPALATSASQGKRSAQSHPNPDEV